MSNHISEIYSNEIHDNLRPLYANWEPGQPISLGDYGLLQGSIFVRLGSIQDLGITIQERSDKKKDQKFFSSKGSADVKFTSAGLAPAGGTVNLKASLEVDFSNERAVFFNAADCQYSMVADKVALGDEVMKRYRDRKWKRGWTIVTDLVQAGATTLAVSGGSSSSIIFEAAGNVPNIDLADASIGLSIKSARNVGYQVVAAQGLVPLIGLSGVKPRFLWFDNDFRPLTMTMRSPTILDTMRSSDEIQTEQSEDELVFAQVE
jgi:hypothetical protein